MDLSARLQITEKGIDEIERRAHNLSIRKRSVLVQLKKPQTVAYILEKSVFHQDEIFYEINALEHDGFLALGKEGTPEPSTSLPVLEDNFTLTTKSFFPKPNSS